MAKFRRANPRRIDDSCERMTELILDYLTDRLAARVKSEFEQHLKICPDCVSFLNTYKKTVALSGAVVPEAIPAKVRSNVLAFLRQKIHRATLFLVSVITQMAA